MKEFVSSRYGSRKFVLALMSMLVSHVGLFTSFIDASVWMQAQLAILGSYGAANVFHGRNGGKDEIQ